MPALLLTAAIAVLTTTASLFGIYNYLPLSVFERSDTPSFGTTVTTINGSDTLSGSRTTINNNFAALNAGKIENSSTSVAAITTLPNLSSVGALTTGSLGSGFTAINVAQGGTGSTTLSSNQLLLGNGTSQLKTVTGFGTSGQFLTSNGAASAPTWQSATVDQTQSYNFTGSYLGTKNLNASSTAANPITLNGLTYSTPGVRAASSTVLCENGSGALSWCPPDWGLLASTTLSSAVASTTLNFATTTEILITLDVPTHSGGHTINLQLNNDVAANYSWENQQDSTFVTGNSSQVMQILTGNSSSLGGYYNIRVNTTPGRIKRASWNGTADSEDITAGLDIVSGIGLWSNTSSGVSHITIGEGSNLQVGTRVSVYGSAQ